MSILADWPEIIRLIVRRETPESRASAAIERQSLLIIVRMLACASAGVSVIFAIWLPVL